MIIKQNEQFELSVEIEPYKEDYSIAFYQHWPKAQRPHTRRIFQCLLSDADLDRLACFLLSRGSR